MKRHSDISEEFLNAFVDDQLELPEQSRVFEAVGSDPELSRRVCEQRGLKEMVQHAYKDVPVQRRQPRKTGSRLGLQSLAAALVLAVGAASGWLAHGWTGQNEGQPLRTARFGDEVAAQRKVILHVSSSQPEKLKAALDETENLLSAYKHSNRQLRLEVIANSDGVKLLQAGASPYAQRISALREQYPNLTLLACHQTVEKMRRQGARVELLPGVAEAPSALDQVVLRLRQGWDYIKV